MEVWNRAGPQDGTYRFSVEHVDPQSAVISNHSTQTGDFYTLLLMNIKNLYVLSLWRTETLKSHNNFSSFDVFRLCLQHFASALHWKQIYVVQVHRERSWNLGKPLHNTIYESLRTKTVCPIQHLKGMQVSHISWYQVTKQRLNAFLKNK